MQNVSPRNQTIYGGRTPDIGNRRGAVIRHIGNLPLPERRHFHELLREEHACAEYAWVKQARQEVGLVHGVRPIPGMLLHIDGRKHHWFSDDRYYDLLVILERYLLQLYARELVEIYTTSMLQDWRSLLTSPPFFLNGSTVARRRFCRSRLSNVRQFNDNPPASRPNQKSTLFGFENPAQSETSTECHAQFSRHDAQRC